MAKHEWMQTEGSGYLAVVEGDPSSGLRTSCDWGDGILRPCSPDVVDWMPEILRLADIEQKVKKLVEVVQDYDNYAKAAGVVGSISTEYILGILTQE